MLAESGGRGLLIEEDVARHVRGVTNVLRTVGALSGRPELVKPPTVLASFDWVRSAQEGIFHPRVRVADRVEKGAVVGDMIDLHGEPLGDVVAPSTGIVLFTVTSPAIKKDGLLLAVGALP
jgi:predicted deacylase